MRELPGGLRELSSVAFAVKRGWYRMRYRRLQMGRGVMIIGRLRIGHGTSVRLGDRVRIRQQVKITGGGRVDVGADTLLNGCWIVAATEVTFGDHCLISDCGITDNDFHNLPPLARHDPPAELTRAPVTIGRNVWLGAHALILKGVHVGEDSVVGAGAVVRADVPAGVVVSGNPAAIVKRFDPVDR